MLYLRQNTSGIPTSYAYKAYGDVITGIIETEIISIGQYQKFLKLQLEGDQITEIISVVDSEGNEYFEVAIPFTQCCFTAHKKSKPLR